MFKNTVSNSKSANKKIKILMRPCYDVGLQNRIFELQDKRGNHWQYPLYKLRSVAQIQGIEIDTWDMYPLSEADLILVQDLPAKKEEIINAKKQAPNVPFIALFYESPLDRTHFYNPKNHDIFDAIITFNHYLCDDIKYFHYQLPLGVPDSLPPFISFEQRQALVMINTNKYAGLLAQRNLGRTGLPLVGASLGGWKISWLELFKQQQSNLCQRRRKIARLAENKFPELLSIYGQGWQGESISWLHKFIPPRPFKNAFGRTTLSKLETLSKYKFCLAFENITGNYGYISEKIFDCFYAGVVPIYLGDENISNYIPSEAFVDARQFTSDLELLKYVRDCPQSVWQKMYDSGQAYLKSESIKLFQTDTFVARILEIINLKLDRPIKTKSSHTQTVQI